MASKKYTSSSIFSGNLKENLDLQGDSTSFEEAINAPVTETVVVAKNPEPEEPKKPEPAREVVLNGMAKDFFKDAKRKSEKNSKCFYIQDDLYEKLEFLAKEMNVSVSTALNTILEKVL